MLSQEIIDNLIYAALQEDIGNSDITSDLVISPFLENNFRIIAKSDLVLCGTQIAARAFLLINDQINITLLKNEGELLKASDIIMEITGRTADILKAERVALNLLRQMSGVATYTNLFVEQVKGTKAQILDTRKTIPGLKYLQKHAVKIGGGVNHRFTLSDGILIKDNHINACGGIKNALALAKQNAFMFMKIEVECETKEQVEEALQGGADIIMFDNMSTDDIRNAVKLCKGRVITEASGNMSLERAREVAKTGVDFISVGAITHAPLSVDISLECLELNS